MGFLSQRKMSATEKTLKKQLFESLRQDFGNEGFKLVLAKGTYTRRSPGMAHIFYLVSRMFQPSGWGIRPEVGIRIDPVEEIFHKVSGTPPQYHKESVTIGAPLGTILWGDFRKYEFDLIEEADLPKAAQGMHKAFHEFALPFFQKNGSLEAIDTLLNADPGNPERLFGPGGYGILRSTIVAKLVNRPDYDSLVQAYSKQIAPLDGGFHVQKFQTLLALLESTSPLSKASLTS